MSERNLNRCKILRMFLICAILLFSYITSENLAQIVNAAPSYTGATKPMQFYFHYRDTPVTVAGLETKYIFDTTRQFSFSTQQEAFANSFYKAEGLPKIEVDFYLYPNLAGPVTIDGSWQVFIWANASAYKPAGFTLQFKEITIAGETLWDSGLINPTVISSVGEYIDVPIYNYNLSTPLTHTFGEGTTLFVGVEVNAGSSADTRIWYDSELYPSKIILPAKDYARPREVRTCAYDGRETILFHYNWSQNQRIVKVRANVTDPFGGYDIYRVNMTILDPAGNPVVDDISMGRISNGQWETGYLHLLEANYTYASTAQRGNYTLIVSVVDNNGHYRNLDLQVFDPFIEHFTHTFSIGIILYFDPAFQIVDDVNDPLPNAQVYVKWPNGSRDVLPRYTSANGFINFTGLPSANYEFTILWKDSLVKQATVDVVSNGPYVIKTDVYQLTVEVLGNDQSAVRGAYVIVYTQSGIGYGLSVSDEFGQAIFKLPKGVYNIEAHLSGEYWLRAFSTVANETGVNVDASKSKTVALAEFPPPIWTTTGFWLVFIPVLALIGFAVYKMFWIPRRSHKKKKT